MCYYRTAIKVAMEMHTVPAAGQENTTDKAVFHSKDLKF
jgi:hypothetical protein